MPVRDDIIDSELAIHRAVLVSQNLHGTDYLRQSLQEAIDSEDKISDELDKLTQVYEEAEDDIERTIIDYQKDLVVWELTRAADISRVRMSHLDKVEAFGKMIEENEKCFTDMHHWLKFYAWTHDPRGDAPLTKIPLNPFPFQYDYMDTIRKDIFIYRRGRVIDKSREMGATWCFLDLNVYLWLYSKGYYALFGSMKEELVDEKWNMKSLFEKMRYQIRLLPDWMIPKGVDVNNLPFAKLYNPQNESTLDGESANQNIGRSNRATAAFLDEFQTFPGGGDSALASLTDVTRSIFMIGTAHGHDNRFYVERFAGRFKTMTLHWTIHPWKDHRWYLWQKRLRPAHELAQEVDIDYEASVAGRLLGDFNPLVHFITWDEFAEYFSEKGVEGVYDHNRQPRIPHHWICAQGLDIGTNPKHPTCYSAAATPAVNEPLRDCVFVFISLVLDGSEGPVTPQRIHYAVWEAWQKHHLHIGRFAISYGSHEQKTTRDALVYDVEEGFQIPFAAWDGSRVDGISAIQNYLQERDGKEGRRLVTHPFRPYLSSDDIPVSQRHYAPRIFFICTFPQGSAYFDEATGRWMVRPPIDEYGHARVAFEFPKYHTPEENTEMVRANPNAPVRKDNDIIDAMRMYAHHWFVPNAPLTEDQIVEQSLPKNIRKKNIADIEDPDEKSMTLLSRRVYMSKHKINRPNQSWREQLYSKLGRR